MCSLLESWEVEGHHQCDGSDVRLCVYYFRDHARLNF
jgi:hypothetical protein